eukprot:jgi/Botrbrau1/3779/Bobra.0183s0014.1
MRSKIMFSRYPILMIYSLALAGVVLCKHPRTTKKPCMPANGVLNNTQRLSLFSDAVAHLGVLDLLEDPRFRATVFAPENSAWETLPARLGLPDQAALLEDPRTLSVLLYHIVPLKVKVKKEADEAALVVPTLLEQRITVGAHHDGLTNQGADSSIIKGFTRDNLVQTGHIWKACRISIVEINGVLMPNLASHATGVSRSFQLVEEWKLLLNRMEAIREAEEAGRGAGKQLQGGNATAMSRAAGQGHGPHKGHGKHKGHMARVSLSARLLAFLGLKDDRHRGRSEVPKLEHRRGPNALHQGAKRQWLMLDKVDPKKLLRAVHSGLSSFLSRTGHGKQHGALTGQAPSEMLPLTRATSAPEEHDHAGLGKLPLTNGTSKRQGLLLPRKGRNHHLLPAQQPSLSPGKGAPSVPVHPQETVGTAPEGAPPFFLEGSRRPASQSAPQDEAQASVIGALQHPQGHLGGPVEEEQLSKKLFDRRAGEQGDSRSALLQEEAMVASPEGVVRTQDEKVA